MPSLHPGKDEKRVWTPKCGFPIAAKAGGAGGEILDLAIQVAQAISSTIQVRQFLPLS